MLRLAVIAVSLVVVGVAVAGAQAPADPRAVAFRDDCASTLFDLAETRKRIKSAGWESVDPAAHAHLKGLHDAAREASSRRGGAVETFSRMVGDRRLYMLLRGNVLLEDAFRFNECNVYDFDDKVHALDPDSDRVIERWLGETPTSARNQPGTIARKYWQHPENQADIIEVSLESRPTEMPRFAWYAFPGRTWMAQAAVAR